MQIEQRDCENCEFCVSWTCGGGYYEPPDYGWDCNASVDNLSERENLDELIELHDRDAATWCKHYKEKLFTSCPTCKKEVNAPLKDWTIYCHAWEDSYPVCSQECIEIESKKADELREQDSVFRNFR